VPLEDGFGLPLTTPSATARDAYVEGVGCLLSAQPGAETALRRALAADEGCALAHAALARVHQSHARAAAARTAIAAAARLTAGLTARERGHVHALERVVMGDAPGALAAIRAHLGAWPRDLLVMAPCTGVFGLFGFSGRAGREQALDAFLAEHAAACGDDPWFLAWRAFAQCEAGRPAAARAGLERSFAARPDNANAAHVRAHLDYECGHDAAGRAWLRGWCHDYPGEATLHGHLHWHLALWALEAGNLALAWELYDTRVRPGAAWGPPLNLLTDAASLLLRAEWAGLGRPLPHWQAVADCARTHYPQPGVAFADVHAALAFAMTGARDDLARLRDGARGPAADLVAALAQAFEAYVDGDHAAVLARLLPCMDTHERLGGSRAQRDLLEQMVRVARRASGQPSSGAHPRGRPLPAWLGAS